MDEDSVPDSKPRGEMKKNPRQDEIQYSIIWRIDAECISNLLTFDHLQLMCHNQQILPPLVLDPSSLCHNPLENWPHAVAIEDKRIHRIPFAYNLMNLLPKCQQAELLSPMFIQALAEDLDFKHKSDAPNKLLMDSLLAQLHELHHRELRLSDHESAQLVELITQRQRDESKHPVPFPTGLVGAALQGMDSTETTDESASCESDSSRLNSSYSTQSPSAASPSGSSEDVKMPRNIPKTRASSKQQPTLKWRCFVKSMASTHCVLTFVPDSYQDLKILMLGSEPKMYEPYEPQIGSNYEDLEDVLNFSNTTIEEFNSTTSHDLSLQSKSSSRLEIDSQCSEEDLVFDTSYPSLKEKYDQPFRVRSSSWDPVKKHTEIAKMDLNRYRTSSVGAKMKPVGVNKRVFATIDDKKEQKPKKQIKVFCGSLMLPIYVYDCPLSSLVDALIFKSGGDRRPDIFQNTDGNFESAGKEPQGANGPDEVDLYHHCRVISQAFKKCFVMALFKSLHLNHRVTKNDIQKAVSECKESLLEIDITKYIQTICGHLKTFAKEEACSEKSSPFSSPCVSNELLPLHKLIKQRFLEILTVCFKAVETHQEYFFCCPPVHISRANDVNILDSCHRVAEYPDFDTVTLQSDNMDLNSHHTSLTARTSLLSNFDSDSVSDYMNDIGDDLVPLFLHLVCSLRTSLRGPKFSRPVKILPTCLGELISEFNNGEIPEDELASIVVTLDLHCLTLPSTFPADLPSSDSSQDTSGTLSEPSMTLPNEHFGMDNRLSDNLQHLPSHQNKAVNKCVTEIEWFLHDEIATFLLDSLPVTEGMLNFVVNHVSSSDGRYSCVYNTVSLNFVYGPEHSLEKFIEEFSQLKLQGYCLKQLNEYYYLTKITDSPQESSPRSYSCSRCLHSDFCPHRTSWEDDRYSFLKNNFSDLRGDWSDYDCKALYGNKSYKWIQELNAFRKEMPNFWLILKIEADKVMSFFHCRFIDISCEEVQHYKEIHMNILEIIENVCKTVNQTLLLNSLYETRMCDPLLEPESNDDAWTPRSSYLTHSSDGNDADVAGGFTGAALKFPPGWFSCPVVWQTTFLLHPRLKTGPGKPGLSRAIQALRTVLNRFSVNNRTNMFVYQDCTGNRVFYLRLHETVRNVNKNVLVDEDSSPGSVSRSSSITSLSNKKQQDEMQKDMRPRLKSFSEMAESYHSGTKNEDVLTLNVHGISDAGAEVTNELVQVLQNRLDDAVLEVVSVMLARNPMCKLTPDDVRFIQKPHHKAEHMAQFIIPSFAHQSLDALSFYLKQNSMHSLFLPKYTDTKHVFEDYSLPDDSPRRINENSIYLYNQSPGSGNKGIACVALALIDSTGSIVASPPSPKQLSVHIPSDELPCDATVFENIVALESEEPLNSSDVVVEARVWKQGRVNVEILLQKLKNIVQYSLWDLVTEFRLVSSVRKEVSLNEDEKEEWLSTEFCETIPTWMLHGHEMTVPSIKMHTIDITMRHRVGITLKEVNSLIVSQEGSSYIFCEKTENSGVIFCESEQDVPPEANKCFIVTRHFSVESPEDELVSEESLTCFAPRQRFLIAVITNLKVSVFMYNWSKDCVENLTKPLTQLGYWLNGRTSFLAGIILQKMGLFHFQSPTKKSSFPMPAIDVPDLESLVVFTVGSTPRKAPPSVVSNMAQILRDVDQIAPSKKTDPVAACVQQVTSIKFNDQKVFSEEIPGKLQLLSQSQGIAPVLQVPEETLELFLKVSRIMHDALTPLLFHPKWRLNVTRSQDSKFIAVKLSDPSIHQECPWHLPWCLNFIKDYKQYLQSFGYTPILIDRTPRKTGKEAFPKSEEETRCFLHKSSYGGIIIIETLLSPPYFTVKLHTVECTRLQPQAIGGTLMSQALPKFLEECRRIKNHIQLEAFAYDYHLRCIERYLAGKPTYLPECYHVTNFLDDFLKYYGSPPRYSPCLASSGNLSVSKLSTPPQQLFLYLLSHEADYEMDALSTTSIEMSPPDNQIVQDDEYVLFKQKTSQYGGGSDEKAKETLRVSVIVSFDKASSKTSITLNYYVLLNSCRDFCVNMEAKRREPGFPIKLLNFSHILMPLSNSQDNELPQTLLSDSLGGFKMYESHIGKRGSKTPHEELLLQAMTEETDKVKEHIEYMINRGSIDCRIHLLWNKLLSNTPGTSMTPSELDELKGLAHVQKLTDLDERLEPLLEQPLTWYQSLMKILMMKYTPEKYKLFVSPDNNYHQLLILHPRFLDGFVMLTIDSVNNTSDLDVVLRFSSVINKKDVASDDVYNLIECVVNTCCSHLWVTLLNN